MHFENGHNRNFEGPVTLILTFDDLESYIVELVSSRPIHRYIDQWLLTNQTVYKTWG